MIKWLPIVVLLIGALVVLLKGESRSIAGLDEASFVGVIAGVALLIYFSSYMLESYRSRLGEAARDFAVWLAIALALVAAYAFRNEFQYLGQRIVGELTPPGQSITVSSTRPGERAVRLRRRGDGHFVARGEVNGTSVSMIFDTGASTIVLRPSDARRAGIPTDSLVYSIPVKTANGVAYAAGIRLDRVAIGPIRLDGVDALVTKPGTLTESLLGMNFLRRLRSYEVNGDFLTLRG